jgi:hypothetical protein
MLERGERMLLAVYRAEGAETGLDSGGSLRNEMRDGERAAADELRTYLALREAERLVPYGELGTVHDVLAQVAVQRRVDPHELGRLLLEKLIGRDRARLALASEPQIGRPAKK